jgi:hypothetical protein
MQAAARPLGACYPVCQDEHASGRGGNGPARYSSDSNQSKVRVTAFFQNL